MTTEELIDSTIETVNVNNTVDEILDMMQDGIKNILPVVEDNKFMGFVKEDQLFKYSR